ADHGYPDQLGFRHGADLMLEPEGKYQKKGSEAAVWLAQTSTPPSGMCSLPTARQGYTKLKKGKIIQ
ncbi:hypothetical protein NE579_16825, partial [Intestinimonas massiliensis]